MLENIQKSFLNTDNKKIDMVLEEFLEEVSENSLLIERIAHKGKYSDLNIELSKRNIIENFRYFINLSKDKNHKFSVRDIKDCNYNILKDVMIGGILRSESVRLSGTDYIPPSAVAAYYMLKDLEQNVNYLEESKEKDVIEIAAYIHCEIIKIHPFEDGNGRTARAMMNYYLLKNNYFPVVIWYRSREEYLKVNNIYFKNNNLEPYIDFLKNLMLEQYKIIKNIIQE